MQRVRITLVVVTIMLLSVGVIMVYSASAIYAWEHFGDSLFFLKRHLLALSLGIIAALTLMAIDVRNLRRLSLPILLLAIFLLIVVLIPGVGKAAGGARRWFRFWGFSIQPAEFAKVGLIIYLADILSRKREALRLLKASAASGVVAGLIFLQPDLGSAALVLLVSWLMLFISGARLAHLLTPLVLIFPFAYFLIFKVPYRRERILAFLNPWQDAKGYGFQIIQSFIALGCGSFFGRGLGQSRQKLFYLPAAHTDFIFSVLGEELGLLGTLSVVVLFTIFFLRVARISLKQLNPFSRMLAAGLTILIGLEVIVHIGVATGSLPTKGLPLPFISYGGSSLVMSLSAVGILLNISRINRIPGG